MKYIFTILLFILPFVVDAQQAFDTFLKNIETNNRVLSSAQKMAEAERLEAKTGIYLANPELSYDYLNGNSGNYSEMVVSQAFDFPSIYLHKSKIAELSGEQANTNLRQLKIDVYLEAGRSYIQQITINRKLIFYYELQTMLQKMHLNTNKKIEVGEINALEANRINTEQAKNSVMVKMLETESLSNSFKINELNGGLDYVVNDTLYPQYYLNDNSDSLMNEIVINYPLNKYWEKELEKAEREIQLQKSSSLPKIELGYRQDKNSNVTYNGIHAGLSIPLFENKNTIKLAKVQQDYLQEEFLSNQLVFRNSLKQKINAYNVARNSVVEIEELVVSLNAPELLIRSYEAGQISYTEFFSEYSNYIETQLFVEELRQKAVSLQLELFVLKTY